MAGQVVIGAVVNAVQLLPAHGIEVLNIARRLGVVRKLVVVVKTQMFFLEAQIHKEGERFFLKLRVKFRVRAILAEPLVFHLLELDGAENKVAGGDFVAERLADLRNAEGHLGARRALYV